MTLLQTEKWSNTSTPRSLNTIQFPPMILPILPILPPSLCNSWKSKRTKKHGTTSEENWKMIDDWCINHLVSLHEYCISWQVWDHAKGVIHQNYTAANIEYERQSSNGFYPIALDRLETKNLEHHGNVNNETKSILEAWCMSHKNMTIGSSSNSSNGDHNHYPEKKSYCVSWSDSNHHVTGTIYDDIESAKLNLAKILTHKGDKLLQLIEIHTYEKKGDDGGSIPSNHHPNLTILDDWCVKHVSSMGQYCVSWLVESNHAAAAAAAAEGVIQTNYSAAIAKYDSHNETTTTNGTTTVVVVIGVGRQVLEYHYNNAQGHNDKEKLEEWCRTHETTATTTTTGSTTGRAAVGAVSPGIIVTGVIVIMVTYILF